MATKPAPKPVELPPAKLRWKCELSRIPFETTAQADPREGFIGQERALRALKMGVELSAPGFNVFVCGLAGTSRGSTIARMIEGQMVPIEDISKMVHEGKLDATVAEEIERKYEQFRQEFTVVYRKTLTLSRELASELSYLEQEAASVLVDGVIEELKEKYPGSSVAEYLEEVRHHLLDNLDPFKEREGEGEQEEEPPDGLPKGPGGPERDPFRVYGVNVILAHNHGETSPVIFETTPTYANLFGTIQRAYDARGGWSSDFMDLRGGSLLRADGGFLVMYAMEALSETGVWCALKRTLNHNRLEIQPLEMFYPFGGSALKPEAIDINVKVIL